MKDETNNELSGEDSAKLVGNINIYSNTLTGDQMDFLDKIYKKRKNDKDPPSKPICKRIRKRPKTGVNSKANTNSEIERKNYIEIIAQKDKEIEYLKEMQEKLQEDNAKLKAINDEYRGFFTQQAQNRPQVKHACYTPESTPVRDPKNDYSTWVGRTSSPPLPSIRTLLDLRRP